MKDGYKRDKEVFAFAVLFNDRIYGVRQDRMRRVIGDMTAGQLYGDGSCEFSAHHYSL